MSINNLSTDKITVIPAARKTAIVSRLTSEEVLINALKTLGPRSDLSDDSTKGYFIINSDSDYVEFCLGGYYVKCEISTLKEIGNNVYAKLNFAEDVEVNELQGDLDGLYMGINFYTDQPSDIPYLKVISDGEVNDKVKFDYLWSDIFEQTYCPYVLSATEPTNLKKIWIDSAHGYISKVYSSGSWISLGAVAK